MNVSLTREQEALVRRLVDSGRYASERDVLATAFEQLEAFDRLRREVQEGIDALDRGDYVTYDDQGLRGFVEGVKARGRAKLSGRTDDGT